VKFVDLSISEVPLIMGIVNTTPDSFSDGGDFFEPSKAIYHGLKLLEQGANILDIGGESTRPGSSPVSIEEEIRRTAPVVSELKKHGAIISIDTKNAEVMEAALEAGADIINDVSALEGKGSLEIAANSNADIVLMHMQGMPSNMQENPSYNAVIDEIKSYLLKRIETCINAGISKDRICIDPGIGFGKTVDHNLEIFANLSDFIDIDCPILIGASRKSFIEHICQNGTEPKQRLAGSIAAAIASIDGGAKIIRTHDVFETIQAIQVWKAIRSKQ
jgi:dihydropteroate synthase